MSASDFTLTKSMSYKDYELWYLSFSIQPANNILTSEDPVIIHKIIFNEYDIGSLALNIINEPNDLFSQLKLNSCAGASVGMKLANYHATFENIAVSDVFISKVDTPFFDLAKPHLVIDNSDFDLNSEGSVKIAPLKVAEIYLDLSGCEKQDVNVYYVSPVIHYKVGTKDYSAALNYYTSRLNISRDELKMIGDSLFPRQ